MSKNYKVLLNDQEIGTTEVEKENTLGFETCEARIEVNFNNLPDNN